MNAWLRRLTITAAAGGLAAGCSLIIGYRAAPISGRIVETGSGQPLADTLVVVSWHLRYGDEPSGLLYAEETLSNANGEYHFKGWSGRYSKRGSLSYGEPDLLFYHSGYVPQRVGNSLFPNQPGINGETVHSDWDGREVALLGGATEPQRVADQAETLGGVLDLKAWRRCEGQQLPRLTTVILELGDQFRQQGLRTSLPSSKDLRLAGCPTPSD